MDMIYWDHYYNLILFFNLLIIIGLFASLRLFSGSIAHINALDELSKKDNPAFGISLAGATLAVAIMLSGTVYGSPENTVWHTIVSVGAFGVLGIILMAVTRLIFDKLTLRKISLRHEIIGGNIAVAIADAGNALAMAIIIRAIMIWVTVTSAEGVVIMLGGYVASQLLMTVMTLLRIKLFGRFNQGSCLQSELKKGNIALALVFAGKKIGTAFAIATAAQIVVYEEYDMVPILAAWLLASVFVILAWKVLCYIAKSIILCRVDVYQEILDQRNMAVGAFLAAIYISMGLLIFSL